MVTHVLGELFAWPSGIVDGNLIASALWAAPALVHLHRKINRHHREQMAARQDLSTDRKGNLPAIKLSFRISVPYARA